jgi:hypothetical protein
MMSPVGVPAALAWFRPALTDEGPETAASRFAGTPDASSIPRIVIPPSRRRDDDPPPASQAARKDGCGRPSEEFHPRQTRS